MRRPTTALGALLLVGACDLTESGSRFTRPAQLRVEITDSITFTVPDTVAINADFQVSVLSYGGGCESKGPTNLSVLSNGTAELRPLDLTELGEVACTQEIKTFTHSGTVRFTSTGSHDITVFGRDADNDTLSRKRSVHVR